jgi:Co/Zn/Cd efflux system component
MGQTLSPRPANLQWLSQMPMVQWDPFMYWTIAEGGAQYGNAMPAFKNKLSKDDICSHRLHTGPVATERRQAAIKEKARRLTDTITAERRETLVREAFRLEYLTVVWMVIEASVAIGAGVAARSLTLLAFGIDSVIELTSAGVLIWRLTVELRRGQSFAESAEHTASRIGGALLFALAAYVVVAAGWSLVTRQGAEFSWAGLLVSLAAIPIMWLLSRRKLRLADALASRALRADAVESITCGWLSFVVLIGLLAQRALGAWWVDAVTSLVIVGLSVKEGREAWTAEEDDD